MSEDKICGSTCYCDDVDHEVCWDGLGTFYDSDCSCCRDTKAEQLNQ